MMPQFAELLHVACGHRAESEAQPHYWGITFPVELDERPLLSDLP
jgi:hypothetical protein